MRTLALCTFLGLLGSSLCGADEVNRDEIARKFGTKTWKRFVEQSFWYWTKADSSEFTPAEIAVLLDFAKERERPVPDTHKVSNVWFVLRLKFKDPKAIELLNTYFARGWYWADEAEQGLSETGELSLIPLAAKYLWVQVPTEPEPKMSDVIFEGPPSVYAAEAIRRLLGESHQTPEAVKKASYDDRVRYYTNVPIFRRWWAANEERIRKGDYAHLSKPLEYLDDQHVK